MLTRPDVCDTLPPAPKWHVMLGRIILQKFSYAEEVKRREAKMNVVFRYARRVRIVVPCRIYFIEKDIRYILMASQV